MVETRRRRAPAMSPDERRAVIVAATLPLLVEHGTAVTTRQIATASGIAEGTVFRAFADKQELLWACLHAAFDPGSPVRALAKIPSELPIRERLLRASATVAEHWDRAMQVGQAVRSGCPGPPGGAWGPSGGVASSGPADAVDVSKTFGAVTALDGVSVSVARGSVHGLLGHNGAGKTTLVDVLTTLRPPTGGNATVAGFDVVRAAAEVRRRIGVTGQFASVDEDLTGTQNLVLVGRLLGASRRQAAQRAAELLELFGLAEAADRPAKDYSGGMRRRLDLASSLTGHPDVVFLDEPTTGLDPESRLGMWDVVRTLVAGGTTVLLTTQYLEEADQLADAITVLSHGRVIAAGTAAELKTRVGRRTVSATLALATDIGPALDTLRRAGLDPLQAGRTLTAPVDSSRALAVEVRALDEAGIEADELGLHEPTLDDVYLTLTGANS